MARLSDGACRKKYTQQQGLCFICDESMHPEPYVKFTNPLGWNRDHLTPRNRGGPDRKTNIVLTHVKCNSRKGHDMPTKEDRKKFSEIFGYSAWRAKRRR